MTADTFIFYILLFPLTVFLFIVIYNYFTAPRFSNQKVSLEKQPLISILIPARNEEENIGDCIKSALNQSYRNIEIIVCDDNSTDNTENEVLKIKSHKIKLIKGEKLPKEWLGKNWACHQLSKRASGDYLLFTDADVRLKRNTVEYSIDTMHKNVTKMLSCFSTQKIVSFGEWFVVPLVNWLLLTFLPLKKVLSSKNKKFVAANGQFILFEKDKYFEISGHEAVKDNVVEDMEFARILKSKGEKIITLLGNNIVNCRMYKSFTEGIKGFSKNFYPGFKTNPATFLLLITFFLILFLLPFVLFFQNYFYLIHVIIIISMRILLSMVSNQNALLNVLLHPLQMVMMFLIGVTSIYTNLTKKVEWKGRQV